MSTTTAYLRVSTDGQDLKNQRYAILDYADRHGLRIDSWMEVKMSSRRTPKERRIDDLVNSLNPGDSLIVSELSRLGRSVGQIITLVDELVKKQVSVIVIKQGIVVNGKRDIATTTLITMLGLFAEIERELISERTRMGLAKARAEGKLIGRPRGSRSSQLDARIPEIKEFLAKGISRASIAKLLGVKWSSLQYYLKSRALV
jgi:DNA invertase Pin-like site-specific DNA recombinase